MTMASKFLNIVFDYFIVVKADFFFMWQWVIYNIFIWTIFTNAVKEDKDIFHCAFIAA